MYLGNMALMNPYMTVARDLSKLHGLSAGSELAWRAVEVGTPAVSFSAGMVLDMERLASRARLMAARIVQGSGRGDTGDTGRRPPSAINCAGAQLALSDAMMDADRIIDKAMDECIRGVSSPATGESVVFANPTVECARLMTAAQKALDLVEAARKQVELLCVAPVLA